MIFLTEIGFNDVNIILQLNVTLNNPIYHKVVKHFFMLLQIYIEIFHKFLFVQTG